jgi:Holliday junction resolvase RusA-like endonuclease
MKRYTFSITPTPAPRMNRSDSWKQRPCVLKYWAFKDELVRQAKKMGFKLGNKISIKCYMPMPESWSETKKHRMDGEPHQQKPDFDNLLKAFCDALTDDDSKIYDGRCQKFWSKYYSGIEILENK